MPDERFHSAFELLQERGVEGPGFYYDCKDYQAFLLAGAGGFG